MRVKCDATVHQAVNYGPQEWIRKGMFFAFQRVSVFIHQNVATANLAEDQKELFKRHCFKLNDAFIGRLDTIFPKPCDQDEGVPLERFYKCIEEFKKCEIDAPILPLPPRDESILSFEGFCNWSMASLVDFFAKPIGEQWCKTEKVWGTIQLSKQKISSEILENHVLFHFDPLPRILFFLEVNDLCAMTLTCKAFYLSVGLLEWKNHVPKEWGLENSTNEEEIRKAAIFKVFLAKLDLSSYCRDLNSHLETELKNPKGSDYYSGLMSVKILPTSFLGD